MKQEFEGKIVLITGGASGIGKETARQFLLEGAKVLVTDLNTELGEAFCRGAPNSENVAFFHHDVATENGWQNAMSFVREKFGKLNILVNSAGIAISTRLEDMTLEEWQFQNSVNLDGTFLGVKYAIKEMKGVGGSIVNIASIAADVGIFAAPAYCASKAGVKNFTKAAALYCAHYKYNIRVNAIMPGYIETPMVEGILQQQGTPGSFGEKLRELHPMGHFGQPEDIAAGILFAASDKAKFMTGSAIPI
ncbi:MAG: SDR family oxidoreductase, partial [Sneathiella sp.]|nr:SDR family oxidoreductase [Sneathiella sp.]